MGDRSQSTRSSLRTNQSHKGSSPSALSRSQITFSYPFVTGEVGEKEGDSPVAVVPAVAKALPLRGGQEHHSVQLTKLEPDVG